jgi:hypothetical protein
VVAGVWVATAVLPLLRQAGQRAAGRPDRAQEEVVVIEAGARRLIDTGTPYLDRAGIAALPEPDRLLGYLPYQPAMSVFGLPRALDPAGAWWSDARVWFALATVAALVPAAVLVARSLPGTGPAGGTDPADASRPGRTRPAGLLVRAVQAAAAVPLVTLTAATGGDDLPVLALCLLAFTLAAGGRPGAAGLAVGGAAALKLFAWPIAVVLGAYLVTRGRAATGRYLAGLVSIPLVTALPALVVDPGALVENVVAFPLGRGLVQSPAASPLPGYLIAHHVPGGRTIAIALLLAAGAFIAVIVVRRPPRTAGAAAGLSAAGLLTATLLLPATRFGYLLYPLALAVWAVGLPARSRA